MTNDQVAGKTIFIRATMLAALLALGLHDASVAHGSDLSAFLERAEQMSLYTKPVRADVKITRDGKPADAAVLIFDPTANREFFALKSSGWRALLPIGWGEGKAVTATGKSPVTHSSDEPLGTTGLRGMEFFPFWKTDYNGAFVSDSNRTEKTVTLYAKTGLPYVLFVITFDKEKLVPLAIKYYKDNMNNLVRLRRDSDFVMVGSRPRPRHVEIRDFTENSNTLYDFTWRTLDSVPEGLTKDQTFDKAALDWPTEPIAAR
jgi:hypothetical protein